MRRNALSTGLCALALLAFAPAVAAEPEIAVELRCPTSAAPGRVRCDLDAMPPAGMTLTWADVVVLPGSIPPLRGRLAPSDGDVRPERATFAFAVLAKDRGPAEVKVAVRAVVCREGSCRTSVVEKKAAVLVQ
jgi:hypothetical protein